jgi:hypothetical protein
MNVCTGLTFDHSHGHTRVFRVTEDLATCLHSVIQSEKMTTPKFLWIDQVCIDQTNVSERNSQVACMTEIYRRASRVLVWLGQAGETTNAVECVIDSGAGSGLSTGMGDTLQQDWVASACIFARDWFRRLWVR